MNDKLHIVIIEDMCKVQNGIAERLVCELKVPETNISCFNFVDEAIGFLENEIPDILIVDLAMDSVGLTSDDKIEAKNARLTGWVFLKNYVINGVLKDKLKNTHCYIFSGYGRIFSSELGIVLKENKVNISEINNELLKIRENLRFVPKTGNDGGAEVLVNTIKNYSIETTGYIF